MWHILASIVNAMFGRTRLQSGQAVYSQNEVWRVQSNLPDALHDIPRYTIHAVGRWGQMEMYDAWTCDYGVMLDCGAWLPGAWIDSAGHTDGPIDPSDTWSEA